MTLLRKDVDKYNEVFKSVVSETDKSENDQLPSISVSNQEINFGEIQFYRKYKQTITLENTGQVPVFFKITDSREELNNQFSSRSLLESMGIQIQPMAVSIINIIHLDP